ncbi:MAG TPA: glycosyltransferase family 87 protein [Blastocatellia bacterium]|nr:glycosyltransferase family 87 protein [Blastocatellia bacterium]
MQEGDPTQGHSSPSRSKTRAPRVVLAGCIAIALGVLLGGLHFAGRSGATPDSYSNDFNVYYHASREVLGGHGPYQHSLGDWTPYIYPPFLAELIIPLAVLPLRLAAYLWFLINAASVITAAWMSAALAIEYCEKLLSPGPRIGVAVCAVLIVFRFVLDNFNLGQVNPLVTALVVAHIYLYVRENKGLSALALVAAISIKLTPALMLAYHLTRLRLKFSAIIVSLLAVITLASFLALGSEAPDAFRTFVGRTLKNEQGYNLSDAGNQSLRGAVARLMTNADRESALDQSGSRKLANEATLLLSALLLAAAISSAARASSELSAAAPFVCCMVLLSPLSWKAHFVLLILPLANLLARMKTSTRPWRSLIIANLAAALALFNLTSPRVVGLPAAQWSDAHSLVFVGALLIFIVSVVDALMPKFGKQPHVC